jgi:hypothetical protein
VAAGASGKAVGSLVYELRKNKSKDARTEAMIAGGLASIIGGAITFLVMRDK